MMVWRQADAIFGGPKPQQGSKTEVPEILHPQHELWMEIQAISQQR